MAVLKLYAHVLGGFYDYSKGIHIKTNITPFIRARLVLEQIYA